MAKKTTFRLTKNGKKQGRKLKDIKYSEVYNLALCGCSDREISAMLHCSASTLHVRFRAIIKRGRDSTKGTLRAQQFKNAIKHNNTTMQIWLGKQLLGQKQFPLGDSFVEEAAPSMIEIAAAMDASIPIRPNGNIAASVDGKKSTEKNGGNGNGKPGGNGSDSL